MLVQLSGQTSLLNCFQQCGALARQEDMRMTSSSPRSFFALDIKIIIVTSQEFRDLFRKVTLPAPSPWLYYEQECNNIANHS